MKTWTTEGATIARVECYAHGMENNSYLIYAADRADCAVVDPAGHGEELFAALEEIGRKPSLILLTHGHYDHIRGIAALEERFGTIPIAIHSGDADMLCDPDANMSLRATGHAIALHEAEQLLSDDACIDAAGVSVRVMHTPGHSPGSVCFAVGDVLLTGDTLFYMSAGRSDLPGGDLKTLVRSLGLLLALPGEYAVLPGHDRESSLSVERAQNTFIKYYAPQLLRM